MEIIMPVLAGVIVLYGIIRHVPVFDLFLAGAKEGMRTLITVAPTIVGLMFAVGLLRASGTADLICQLITPVAEKLGFPAELAPMALLRPVSGSGATALLLSVFEECGTDSFPGRVASVLAGSSETTFYAIAVYYGAIGVKHIRHTLPAALAADLTALIASVITVRLLIG